VFPAASPPFTTTSRWGCSGIGGVIVQALMVLMMGSRYVQMVI
jgi:hypothetical protein